ncbi:hypothetical protein AHAS_Ahas09G0226600 [Arachis hypogaea]|uniref:CHORD domain-containing protein n=3 Tax=Arachis TaxID=3817 RepID=A0A445BFV6_ARAHY|nr:hypothetical protein Ahy_A09g042414 isoform A [Arachis hypogaea]
MAQTGKVRCQRIGCDAIFSDDDNPDGSCRYHDSLFFMIFYQFTFHLACLGLALIDGQTSFLQGPIFHDGMKEWSCCKKRSHDFSLFLEIPGCKTGKHTSEKQVIAPVKKATVAAPTAAPSTNASAKDSCSRCRQGFFCSDHGSQVKPVNTDGDNPGSVAGHACAETNSSVQDPKDPKKIVDINEPQVCKNKGCGQTFKEKDNHETACSYHPGPAVFHDRMRGWKCCDIHVKEFDEFMSIPPCTKGWHNADPDQ